MSFILPLSCTPEFKERLNKRFQKGGVSPFIVRTITQELDRLDAEEKFSKQRENWIHTKVLPALKKITHKMSFSEIYEVLHSEENRSKILDIMGQRGVKLNDEHLIIALEEVMKEYE